MRADPEAAINTDIEAAPIVIRDRRSRAAELVVETGAENVMLDVAVDYPGCRHARSARGENRIEDIRDGAEIEEEIFFFYRPVASELGFDPPAGGPTGPHFAPLKRSTEGVDGTPESKKARATGHLALGGDLAIGPSAGGIKQARAFPVGEPPAQRPDPVEPALD